MKDQLPTWAKNKGNFGYGEVNIEGLDDTQFFSHSSIQTEIPSMKGSGISIKPESSPFIASGKIILYTELAPCPSCQSVIEQFKQMYPNIDIEVIYSILK